MAKKQDEAETSEVKDADVAPNPFEEVEHAPEVLADEVEHEDAPWKGAIVELHGTTDELHSIQMRLIEMVPFLPGAIDKADGQLKDFLQGLAHYL